jgi:hypothetical protein
MIKIATAPRDLSAADVLKASWASSTARPYGRRTAVAAKRRHPYCLVAHKVASC